MPKNKKNEISKAVHIGLDNHHKFMIEISIKHIHLLEMLIGEIEEKASLIIKQYSTEIDLIESVPSIKKR